MAANSWTMGCFVVDGVASAGTVQRLGAKKPPAAAAARRLLVVWVWALLQVIRQHAHDALSGLGGFCLALGI